MMDAARVKAPVSGAAPVMETAPDTDKVIDKVRVMDAVTGSATPKEIAARVSRKM